MNMTEVYTLAATGTNAANSLNHHLRNTSMVELIKNFAEFDLDELIDLNSRLTIPQAAFSLDLLDAAKLLDEGETYVPQSLEDYFKACAAYLIHRTPMDRIAPPLNLTLEIEQQYMAEMEGRLQKYITQKMGHELTLNAIRADLDDPVIATAVWQAIDESVKFEVTVLKNKLA